MNENLKKKFIPSRSRLFKELLYLPHRHLYVTECKLKFEEHVFECGFHIIFQLYICFITD